VKSPTPAKWRRPDAWDIRADLIPVALVDRKQVLKSDDMKVTYDQEVDVLRILFRDAPIEESDEDKPGVILDYDKESNIVGLEVLDASQRIENPRGVDYAVTA
jgi:uncharacterized protein YuzE